jgi:hypothetical protein
MSSLSISANPRAWFIVLDHITAKDANWERRLNLSRWYFNPDAEGPPLEPAVRNVPHPTLDQEMAAFRTAGFTDVTIYSSRPTKVCRSECHAGARKKRPNCRQWPVLRYANITECLTPRAISLRGLPEREFGPALQEYERITGLLGNKHQRPLSSRRIALWTAMFVVRLTDWSVGTGPFPDYPQYNRNRAEDTDAKECPSRTPPLILVELFGKQQYQEAT